MSEGSAADGQTEPAIGGYSILNEAVAVGG
jgi:hypothetical protein